MLKFSFLIPMYNGELYISQCLDSLLNQDIPQDEYEILCLDDCSPDNVSEIVKGYSFRYSCVKLFRNETNCRVATNCNKLTSWAKGKYFTTVGQDDYYEPNCLGKLWNRLESDNLDVLVFNFQYVTETGNLILCGDDVHDMPKMSGVEWLHQEFSDRNYCDYLLGYDQRSLYRTEYWRDQKIKCVDGINFEDTVIMLKAIVHSSAVASISDCLYNYRQNAGSIMHVDKHVKKGLYIYEFSFPVGQEVEDFYYDLKNIDDSFSKQLLEHLKWRYNCFGFDLIRTTRKEKIQFYNELLRHKEIVASKKQWLNLGSRILISPTLGFVFSRILEVMYRCKKSVDSIY